MQRFEKEGLLKGERTNVGPGKRPWVTYDAKEVDALSQTWAPRRTTPLKIDNELAMLAVRGRAAQMCFPLFVQHMPLVQIVMQTGLDPTLVRKLHREFETSFADGKRVDAEREEREEDKRLQREHDRKRSVEEYRAWRLKLARENRAHRAQESGGGKNPFFAT